MRRLQIFLYLLVGLTLAACNLNAGQVAPTIAATEAVQVEARPTLLPTLTPLVNNQAVATIQIFATSVLPPTVISNPPVVNQVAAVTRLLNNGRGITTGSAMNEGNFEVEGYCGLLNPAYGVYEDDVNWFCTFQEQSALQLRQNHFDDICQRTYNNLGAFAVQISSNESPAFRWRCHEYTITPIPVPQKFPYLLDGGRGMTTGTTMNQGNFEVEAYCTTINPNYSVSEDDTFWYCTENGQAVLTLGSAEFDDICIRTYNNAAAYAEQINSNADPVFRWRCYELR
jgi:hypothetical protein